MGVRHVDNAATVNLLLLACLTLLILFTGCLVETTAQTPPNGIRLGGAFGGADVDGLTSRVPPGGSTIFGNANVGVGWPLGVGRVSIESEIGLSGTVEGTRDQRGGLQFRERRRDLVWAFLGGLEMWEPHHFVSMHLVGGVSYVKPLVNTQWRSYDVVTRDWTEWQPEASDYGHSWAMTGGVDVLFSIGSFAGGPTLRYHGYLQNPSPYSVAPSKLSLLGFCIAYQF